MRYKPDWLEASERLAALWNGDSLDRPCLAVTAPRAGGVPPPVPATHQERWVDPQGVVAQARYVLESTWWGGEAIPSFLLMGGWLVSLGGRPRFDATTIWFETLPVDFSRPSPFRYDPQDPWVVRHRAVYLAMLEAAGEDDFLVGQPCFLPANDLLSMHMGPTVFLTALIDHPAWMQDAILVGAQGMLQARLELADLARGRHRFWYGTAGWMPLWAPQPYFATQSDVSCMLSPQAFDQFIAPELDVYGHAFGSLWYHLDGKNARQHLPRLLSLPYLRVVQYTPAPWEPPNGPQHLGFYRQIQEAGRIVHLELPPGNVEALVCQLDPSLLMLQTRCGSIEEGEDLLRRIERGGARPCKWG